MKRRPWQDAIPAERLALFDVIRAEFFSRLGSPGYHSVLFYLKEYDELLSLRLSKLAKDHLYPSPSSILKARIALTGEQMRSRREKSDVLLRLIPRWIDEELSRARPVARLRILPLSPLLGSQMSRLASRGRWLELTWSFQNVLCLITWKRTVSELATLASLGDDKSLMRLIELNKRFLTAEFFKDRVIQAQRFSDSAFFERLARAVVRDATREHSAQAEIGFAMLFLWHLGFKELPRSELLDCLRCKLHYSDQDLPSFRVYLSRLGLRQYRKV